MNQTTITMHDLVQLMKAKAKAAGCKVKGRYARDYEMTIVGIAGDTVGLLSTDQIHIKVKEQ